ncbi:hypothetical protein SUGI_1040300 [Cryptomeria japonica]|uniref:citrate-binding protein n=1 Tax=Cryptomeria japonica TaxID=3369 RepID=UPI002414B990|nr:citrate-binding protein [Cryptomeria japonica]GLJ49243.1 hypothetical protein SUGI_1040300 [Cryptomeria japonica]
MEWNGAVDFLIFCLLLNCLVEKIINFKAFMSHQPPPTQGFTQLQITRENLGLLKPYDIDQIHSWRTNSSSGVLSTWVLKDDKPYFPESNIKPRTEFFTRGCDYTGGVWRFEAEMYAGPNTTGVSVMQISGGVQRDMAFMLQINDGYLTHYNDLVLPNRINNQWISLNVTHNANERKVGLSVNGQEEQEFSDAGPGVHFFKFGVQALANSSPTISNEFGG